ncbi:MAG TPA: hypothetical protein EYG86_06920 [Crocinitomicaceae bacterium]|nr:hypothetical protein [Crocinitomicaceae bacterium]
MDKIKSSFLARAIVIGLMMLFSFFIISHYWMLSPDDSITQIPRTLLLVVFGYILFQILKRFLFQKKNWWDWLYYIGLISIVVPVYFGEDTNISTMYSLAKFGVLFLMVPLLLDAIQLMNEKK